LEQDYTYYEIVRLVNAARRLVHLADVMAMTANLNMCDDAIVDVTSALEIFQDIQHEQ